MSQPLLTDQGHSDIDEAFQIDPRTFQSQSLLTCSGTFRPPAQLMVFRGFLTASQSLLADQGCSDCKEGDQGAFPRLPSQSLLTDRLIRGIRTQLRSTSASQRSKQGRNPS